MVQPIWVLLSGSSSSPAAISADHDKAQEIRGSAIPRARRCRTRIRAAQFAVGEAAEDMTTGDNGVVGLAHGHRPGTGGSHHHPFDHCLAPNCLGRVDGAGRPYVEWGAR